MKYTEKIEINNYDVDMHGIARPTALLAKLEEYSREMEEGVAKKDARLSEVGYKNYDK